MKKYTMKDFIERKIAITFENEKEQLAFLKECEKLGFVWAAGEKPTEYMAPEDTGIILEKHNRLMHSSKCMLGREIVSFKDLILSNKEIHITVKGTTTHAILKENGKIVKTTIAKCSPEDEFDFETGAKIAFERLFENKQQYKVGDIVQVIGNKYINHFIELGSFVRITRITPSYIEAKEVDGDLDQSVHIGDIAPVNEVKRKAKIGEYVKVVNAQNVPTKKGKPDYKNGDVLKIIGHENFGHARYAKGSYGYMMRVIDEDEYVVLERAQEQEYYNAELVCVKAYPNNDFTIGKTYTVKNGILQGDTRVFGTDPMDAKPFKSLDEINDIMAPQFIELVK